MSFNKPWMHGRPVRKACNDCSSICPPFSPVEETISTGPIPLIPADNRVEFLLINPTNCEADVTIQVNACTAPTPPVIPTIPGTVVSFSSREITVFGPTAITIAPGDCFEGGVNIPVGASIVDVVLTGPFVICDFEPAQGGLEASVAIGPGRISGGIPQPGLATISTFIAFGDMVIAAEDD